MTPVPLYTFTRRLLDPGTAEAMAAGKKKGRPWIAATRHEDAVEILVFDRVSHEGVDAVETAFRTPTMAKSVSIMLLETHGGSSAAMRRITTLMKVVGRENCCVRVIGQCSSAGIDLLACSAKVSGDRDSRYMVHAGTCAFDEAQLLRTPTEVIVRLSKEDHEEDLAMLKQRIRDPETLLDGGDYHFSAQEALELKLIDSIL